MATLKVLRSRIWTCPSCALHQSPVATFSTSSAAHQISPESPLYIDVPEPPQQQKSPARVVKGTLPVPRDIFKANRGGVERITDDAIDALIPDAAKPLGSTSQAQAKYNEWKQRMSETRKRNLREGLLLLKNRRQKELVTAARRKTQQAAARKERMLKEDRQDDYLTGTSITAALKAQRTSVLPDPDRDQRVAAMAARVEEKRAMESRKRQDAMHALYLRARNFIINEEQLDKHIEEVFGSEQRPVLWGNQGPSIWHSDRPPTVSTLLARTSGKTTEPGDRDMTQRLIRDRLQKVAGKLTGGDIA